MPGLLLGARKELGLRQLGVAPVTQLVLCGQTARPLPPGAGRGCGPVGRPRGIMFPRCRGHCAPQDRAQAQSPVLGLPRSSQLRRAHPYRSAWLCECPVDAWEGVSRLGLWIKVTALQLTLLQGSLHRVPSDQMLVHASQVARSSKGTSCICLQGCFTLRFPPLLKASLTKCRATHRIPTSVIVTGHVRAAISSSPLCAWATRPLR